MPDYGVDTPPGNRCPGHGAAVHDTERQDLWIGRYLAKYRPMAADLSADFIRQNVIVEFAPERAFAVIEREDEFAARATRWVFGHGSGSGEG